MEKLTYTRMNNSDNVITIDLHNGYIIMAVSGWKKEKRCYTTTLFIRADSIQLWSIVEEASALEFHTDFKTINSAILKQVGTYLESGFFDYYINRCDYEMSCISMANELIEKERLLHVS